MRSPGPKPILEYGCRKVPVGWQKLSNYAIIWGIHPADLIPDWSAVRSRQRARGERFDMESAGVIKAEPDGSVTILATGEAAGDNEATRFFKWFQNSNEASDFLAACRSLFVKMK